MLGKKTPQVQMMAVFEIADQGIDGEVIRPDRASTVKVRTLLGAIRTVFETAG